MEQVQKSKTTREDEPQVEDEEIPNKAADLSITDDLLDEIDSVLEQNASEFVRNYVQKGGE